MKDILFTGAGVALVTPMHSDLTVNYDKLKELIDAQIAGGTQAIIVCGTTGESSTLSHEEHCEVIRVAVEHTNKRICVIAGTGSNDTAYCTQLSQEAEQLGVDGLLLITPYYNKTSQRGLIAHYAMVAEAVSVPIILYSVKSRTGMNIAPETCLALSKVENIVGIKEANGDFSQIAKIRQLCGEDLAVFSGNDDQIVPVLALGGKGVISVVSNILPSATQDICSLFFEGKTKQSMALQLKLLDVIQNLFVDVNPIPVKQAMNLMGMDVGQCRMPLCPLSEAAKQQLSDSLRKLGAIG